MSSNIPSWHILTAHAQSFRGARDLAFCLKVPLDSLRVWASSGGSGETARMCRLAWTFAARMGDKYQIRLTRPKSKSNTEMKTIRSQEQDQQRNRIPTVEPRWARPKSGFWSEPSSTYILSNCANSEGSGETALMPVAYVISTIISWVGLFNGNILHTQMGTSKDHFQFFCTTISLITIFYILT